MARQKKTTKKPTALQTLGSDDFSKWLGGLVPAGVDVVSYTRQASMLVKNNANLKKCEPANLLNAICQAASLGLSLEQALPEAYLVPYGKDCQLVTSYRGQMRLAMQAGSVDAFDVDVVREGDVFEVSRGTDPKICHVPNFEDPGEKIVAAYAIAWIGQKYQFVVMSMKEIEKREAASSSAKSASSPWKKWKAEMCKKTVLKSLCKLLPMSRGESGDAVRAANFEDGEVNLYTPPATSKLEALEQSLEQEAVEDENIVEAEKPQQEEPELVEAGPKDNPFNS